MGRRRWTAIGCVVALAVGAVALLGGGALASSSAASPRLAPVVRGLSNPVVFVQAPGEPNRFYVVEQQGTIRIVEKGKVRAAPFLDIRSRVVAGGEQGLLGLAFPKNYAKTRTFYVNYTAAGSGATVIDRYRVRSGRALPASRQQLLTVPQPYANHNGGHLAFGPDGKLWVGLGDGGSGGDPENRAQDRSTLLGKMFRLDVAKRSPSPELVAVGLRNPWRYTFDRRTGDLWIGDVGQGEIEEVSVLRRPFGGLVNFGWDVYEGRARFEDKELGPGRLVQPIAQYTHAARLLDHGRIRLPRHGGREPPEPLRLRRLLQRHDLEHPGCRRDAEGRAGEGREPRLVRRGPQGRALRHLARRNDLPLRAEPYGLIPPVSDFSRTPAVARYPARRRTCGDCPSAAYATAFNESLSARSSRVTWRSPSLASSRWSIFSSCAAIRSRRSRSASSCRSGRSSRSMRSV